ncbi:hypothetical protein [Schaalia sp. lx-260]|uniref:hypothetical protein n=1 Tax=Schaalia sp. lx-260 TaxID=2899082 RepID=UPI001E36E019|nr:hypothetical protein [Schaalia sp. lx-260]MCD4549139.1 hypothetical protein [Schaalia sp. lx-260]
MSTTTESSLPVHVGSVLPALIADLVAKNPGTAPQWAKDIAAWAPVSRSST